MTPFTASHGIVYAREWAMTDADCIAVGEVFRTELHAALAAQDDAAWENARACLHALKAAEQQARQYRNERVTRLRLEAFNEERRTA